MAQKRNKATGLKLKAVGTALLLIAFIIQGLLFDTANRKFDFTWKVWNDSNQVGRRWSTLHKNWLTTGVYSKGDFEDSAAGFIEHYIIMCDSYGKSCKNDKRMSFSDVEALTQVPAEKLIANVHAIYPKFVTARAEIEKAWVESLLWREKFRFAFIVFYALGSVLLIAGIIYEVKGVDE